MSAQPEYILSLENKPFSDKDAAQIKADTLAREAGGSFHVVPHPLGGYAVTRFPVESAPALNEGWVRSGESAAMLSTQKAEQRFSHSLYPSNADIDGFEYFQEPVVDESSSASRRAPIDPPPFAAPPSSGQHARSRRKDSPSQKVTIINNPVTPKKPQPSLWARLGSHRNENPHERPIKFRPAFRGFYMQYILFFFGCIFSSWPIEALTTLGYADVLEANPQYALWVPHIVSITGGIVIALTTYRVVWNRYAYRFVITADSVIRTFGIISRDTKEIKIRKIDSVNIYQGLIDRVLNIGRVDITIPGTAGIDMTYNGVVDPEKLQREIYARIERVGTPTANDL